MTSVGRCHMEKSEERWIRMLPPCKEFGKLVSKDWLLLALWYVHLRPLARFPSGVIARLPIWLSYFSALGSRRLGIAFSGSSSSIFCSFSFCLVYDQHFLLRAVICLPFFISSGFGSRSWVAHWEIPLKKTLNDDWALEWTLESEFPSFGWRLDWSPLQGLRSLNS